jgi:predicted nucleotidyltransferase
MDTPKVIFETVHGSTAFGLAREGSDVDVKGIVIGPASWYVGFIGGPEQIDLSPDHVRYDIRKFMRLATAANPTVLELLFTRPEHHLVVTAAGQRLLDAREQFLSRRVADRFGGYAQGQLKRINIHRGWLLDPPSESDDRWRHYETWRANRNPNRSELEARHGYDTKHAMHLIRIQRMAVEIISTGEVNVHRPDREELLAIRDGALTFTDLLTEVENLSSQLAAATATSPLPPEPDEAALNDLCTQLVQDQLE